MRKNSTAGKRLRIWQGAVIAACAIAALGAPTAVAAGSGATHQTFAWTNETEGLFYNGDGFCTGQTVAGYPVESGMAIETDTPNGGVHATGHAEGTIPLYQASGPPWDVHFGAFVGTLNYRVNFDEQDGPDGQVSTGNVLRGTVDYADGSSQIFDIVFRLALSPAGGPPKVFLVKFVCGPVR